ncbi:EAL domain-containing protein [Leptospira sp. 201903070]|uniref:EAL domain-containing protein n=1 Tax=Leptospira ainlahdjerensis TaxID=2810033 RepID=A0ABS2UAX6_9LEPT|nr:EAL domain-containing protein [Leptospira ainlahdjerensis]MBM9577093.1 EAL domain-containing protein [Leptospira ainlahdjerensis]
MELKNSAEKPFIAAYLTEVQFIFQDVTEEPNISLYQEALDCILESVHFLTKTKIQMFQLSKNRILLLMPVEEKFDIVTLPRQVISIMNHPIRSNETDFFFKISMGAYFSKKPYEPYTDIKNKLTDSFIKASRYPHSHFIVGDLEKEIQMIFALKVANFNKEFFLKYQPILDSKTKKIEYIETLTRWKHPITGNISPELFVPLAEKSLLILKLGEWVIRNAVREFANLRKFAVIQESCKLTINISPIQLIHKNISETLLTVTDQFGIRPDQILIEITETSVNVNNNEFFRFCEEAQSLHFHGFQIAIDDFGKGHSNFSRLDQFQSDIIKIDKNLLSGALQNSSKRKLLGSVIEIMHTMNKKVIIEGVENQEYEKIATEAGADFLQGYHYYSPMDLEGLSQIFGINFQISV